MNRLFALFPLALLTLPLHAADPAIPARVATMTIRPGEITVLHLRPEFESTIHLPDEVTSVVLGSPGAFKAEHSEGEPNYVYVKPTRMEASQSNLLISTKTGQHVSLELINDGPGGGSTPVDFLLEYKPGHGFLISDSQPAAASAIPSSAVMKPNTEARPETRPSTATPSALELEYAQQQRINTPAWTKWENKQIETSLGDVRQWENQVAVSFSVLNATGSALEIVPPQIQIAGSTKQKRKKKKGTNIIADQLEVRDFRLSATRLEPGARADGVVLFDRPNYKQSTEKLYLQLAQADKIEQPILIRLPFTPPSAGDGR